MLELALKLKGIVLALVAANGALNAANDDLKRQLAEKDAQIGERDATITVLRDTIAATQPFENSANK